MDSNDIFNYAGRLTANPNQYQQSPMQQQQPFAAIQNQQNDSNQNAVDASQQLTQAQNIILAQPQTQAFALAQHQQMQQQIQAQPQQIIVAQAQPQQNLQMNTMNVIAAQQQQQQQQQQYQAYTQMYQKYAMMLQTQPSLRNDPNFAQQFFAVQQAIKQIQQQLQSPAKVIVGGNGVNGHIINGINAMTQSVSQPQQIIAVAQAQPQTNNMDLSALNVNFQNLPNDNLPDLSSYGITNNTNQTQSDPTNTNTNAQTNNAQSNDDNSSDLRRIPKYNNPQTNNNVTNTSDNPSDMQSQKDTTNTSNVQLSLPNLNESVFDHNTDDNPNPTPVQPPNHSNNLNPVTPNGIQSDTSSQYTHTSGNKAKRGRGRPRGSRNKKQYNIDEIDTEIHSKRQSINAAKQKFAKAKQTYISITNWLKENAASHQQQLTQQFYATLSQHPQYSAQYGPQQLHAIAQSQAQQKWGQEHSKLQKQLAQAYNDMSMLQSQIKPLSTQLAQLNKKRETALRNTPSGPIADFEAQYMNKQGGLAQRYSNESQYSNRPRQQSYHQLQVQTQRHTQAQAQAQTQAYPNPWQSILEANVACVPQWVQCQSCRKWRVLQVSTREISNWQEPPQWTCAYAQPPNNNCQAPQEKPDQSKYTALQLTALTIQRQIKMDQSQAQKQGRAYRRQDTDSASASQLQARMHEYQQRMEQTKKNNDTFQGIMALVDAEDKKNADERYELLKQQKEAEKAAIRAKRKERDATRQAKKKKLKKGGRDSEDEYLPDSDDTSDDEDYEDTDSDLSEDEMLLRRENMRQRHQVPGGFDFKTLLDERWSHSEVMALVAFAAANDNQFEDGALNADQELNKRHTDPKECQQKLSQIMAYIKQVQNPSKESSGSSSVYRTRGNTRGKSVGSDEEDYDGDDADDAIWGGQRKSSRLSKRTRKRVNYAEEQAIDQYLAREEAEVRSQQKQQNDIYEQKIERILAQKTVFAAPKTQTVFDDMQHALDNGCKASELLEQTRYMIKLDGISYLHCEWATEHQMMHRFGRLRVQRKIQSWQKKRDEYENKCELLWGGEPFDPAFSEVDRIIDCIDVDGAKKYFVKWLGLSYSACTYETAEDVDDAIKIAQYERWNTLPTDTKHRGEEDAAFQKGMYGWYKIRDDSQNSHSHSHSNSTQSGSNHQPAQNEADAKMKRELLQAGITPDEARVYKNENKLRDYQVIGLNWLIQKFYEGSNSILADEMGLGKTVQSTCFIEHLFRVNNVHGPFLIVAPLSTIWHWKREIEGWTDMNCVVYHDSEKGQLSREVIRDHEFYYSKSKRKTPKFNILLTTYEILMTDLEWLANIKWFLCVVDEGHRLKSRSTQLSKSFQLMDCNRRILLTGTPIQNSMDELFNLLHFLEPNEFKTVRDFNRSYGGTVSKDGTSGAVDNTQQLNALQQRIQQYILRRLKENVEKSIPKKEETIIDIELTTIQKTYYRALFDRNREFLEAGVHKSNLPNLINLEVQLRKCCNHPWLIDGTIDRECGVNLTHQEYMQKTVAASGKMVLLDKLLPKLQREGHRVLIFSQMRKVLNILEEYLVHKQYKYERFDGTTSSHDRQAAIDRYCAPDSDRLVFLLTTRAGGQGLNLVAADTVIIFDSDWNPQQDIQAQARCHRIGQKKKVSIYRLVTKNTYEAQMFERASRKLGLGQAILKSVEHGVKKKDVKDLKQLDNMLRHGAYAIFNDDDEATKKWQECDIDELLQHASHKIEHKQDSTGNEQGMGMHSFTRKTFESDKAKATAGLDVTGKNFWNDLWKIKNQSSKKDDEDLYLDNYLLDDKTRADRLLTSLTSMKDAARELTELRRQERNESESDSDVIDDEEEKIFASDKKRDKWFKRYALHMNKMVSLKESPSSEVPSLDLQIQLSNLVLSLQKHFRSKQKRKIQHWNGKLTQRNRRKAKKSLNEDKLAEPWLDPRSSRRKRKRSNDLVGQSNNKKRKANEASPRDKLDRVWAFDYPSYAFNWADSCAVCEKAGQLVLCEGPCVGSFHIQCIGLERQPEDDPWYCDECKQLYAKRQEIYGLTGGKSSRFKPKTYKVKIWMDNDNDDPKDVYPMKTETALTAKCFYPSKKTKTPKSNRKSNGRNKKRSRAQMRDLKDGDYNIDDEPVKKRTRKSVKKKKGKSKRGRKPKVHKVSENKSSHSVEEDILSDFGTRMTRSRKKNLSKILSEGTEKETVNVSENENVIEEQKSPENIVMNNANEGGINTVQNQNQQFFTNVQGQPKLDFNALFMTMNNNNSGNGNVNANANANNMDMNSLMNSSVSSMLFGNMGMSNMNNVGQQMSSLNQMGNANQMSNANPANNTTIINNITNINNHNGNTNQYWK